MLVIEQIQSIGGGTGEPLPGLTGMDPAVLAAYTYWAALIVAVLAIGGVYFLLRSRVGLMLTAIRDDERAARSSGVRVGLARLLVFVVAAAGCGAAGGVLAIQQLQVVPGTSGGVFSVQWTAEMAFAVIIGGIGTIEGPIIGTVVFIVLQQTLESYNAWYLIVLGLVAIVIAIFVRRGLWGTLDDKVQHPAAPHRLLPVARRGDPATLPSLEGGRRPGVIVSLRPTAEWPGQPAARAIRVPPRGCPGPTGHNGRVLLAEVAEVSRAVAGASGRLAKIAAIAAALRTAGPGEVPIVVAYLSGELPQRQIGVGWAALRSAPPAAVAPSLTVLGVDASFSEIGAVVGPGSVAERKRLVDEVMSAATIEEQYFLVRLLSGELRQGALDGVMTEAVARASEVPVALVRRAVMLRGSLPAVAEAALDGGAERAVGLRAAGRPAAQADARVERAVGRGGAGQDRGRRGQGRAGKGRPGQGKDAGRQAARGGGTGGMPAGTPAAVEWKLDGIRIQAHVSGGSVRLFTRTLDDITGRLPEVVAALAALPLRTAVFDGELIALRPDGRPYAFQDTAARAASQTRRRRGAASGGGRSVRAAVGVPVRRAAPGRGRPHRPARRGAASGAGRRRPGRDADAAPGDGRRGGGGRVLPRRRCPGARGRGGQVAGHPLRGRAARRGLDQGQAAAHARPGGARGRVGARPTEGVAVQPAPGSARSGDGRLGDARARRSRASPTSCSPGRRRACWSSRTTATTGPSTSGPSWSSRSRSTACSALRAIPAASR